MRKYVPKMGTGACRVFLLAPILVQVSGLKTEMDFFMNFLVNQSDHRIGTFVNDASSLPFYQPLQNNCTF